MICLNWFYQFKISMQINEEIILKKNEWMDRWMCQFIFNLKFEVKIKHCEFYNNNYLCMRNWY